MPDVSKVTAEGGQRLESNACFTEQPAEPRLIIEYSKKATPISDYDKIRTAMTVLAAMGSDVSVVAEEAFKCVPYSCVGTPVPNDKRLNPVPRNSPCPCGSGKKYKRCHGA